MQTALISVATAAVLAFSVGQATAATLMIDDFNGDQTVTDVPTGVNVNASAVADAGVLGGYRDLQITNTVNNGNSANATELRVGSETLSFSNIAQARGKGYITYDGDADTSFVNTTGLGGVNFAIGDNPYFVFDVAYFDQNAFIAVEVWDIYGGYASYTESLTTGFNPNLSFSEMTGADLVDWSKIGALRFFVDSTNTEDSVDGVLRSVSISAVPVPAPALLLLGGLGGLAALRRRKKA